MKTLLWGEMGRIGRRSDSDAWLSTRGAAVCLTRSGRLRVERRSLRVGGAKSVSVVGGRGIAS